MKHKILIMRLSQNFSFWESNLKFKGKSGLQTAFSKAIPKINQVLGMALVLVIFCGIKLFSQEDTRDELEYRRNKFIDEGFGFNYLDDEITDYELFLSRHNNPVNISEYAMGTELFDKNIVLEYDSMIVTFWTCEYGTVLGTGYKEILWKIDSKDKINYLYGIRHGLAIGELENIIGKVEFDESYDAVVILKNEKNHGVVISFLEEKIIKIEWFIEWFAE